MSDQDRGPGWWSTEPLGGKQEPEEDVSPGAEAALGGDPFGLSGKGDVVRDSWQDSQDGQDAQDAQDDPERAPRQDPAQQRAGEAAQEAARHQADTAQDRQPGNVQGNGQGDDLTPGGSLGGGRVDLGADRGGRSGPGNPGSVANTGTP